MRLGSIGRHLVECLLARDGRIYVLVREQSQDKLNEPIEHGEPRPPAGYILCSAICHNRGSASETKI